MACRHCRTQTFASTARSTFPGASALLADHLAAALRRSA
jgi:hypothetical protein